MIKSVLKKHAKRSNQLVVLLLVLFVLSGCVTMPETYNSSYKEIKELGAETKSHKVKSPTLAGCLNLFYGLGHMYLACGDKKPKMWAMFAVNLELWPISILWGIPAAVVDARRLNRIEVVEYYTADEEGIDAIEKLRKEVG